MTEIGNSAEKPLECSSKLTGENFQEDLVTCECPNKRRGCKWSGYLKHYKLHHAERCNFQIVKCFCEKEMLKGFYLVHFTLECKYRSVHVSQCAYCLCGECVQIQVLAEHLKKDCRLKLPLQPGIIFSNTEVYCGQMLAVPSDAISKKVKDQSTQCDLKPVYQNGESEEENRSLKSNHINTSRFSP